MFNFESVSMYRIAFGLNDQKEKIQLIDSDKAYQLVTDYCADHFGGATVYTAKGVYKHENGIDVVRENTIVCDLCYVSDSDVSLFVEHFKKVLNQESVMVIPWPQVNVSFA